MVSKTITTWDNFYAQDYDRHFAKGTLSLGLVIHCNSRKSLDRVRARVYGYAKSRNHLIEVTMLDPKNLQITYTGLLHLDK